MMLFKMDLVLFEFVQYLMPMCSSFEPEAHIAQLLSLNCSRAFLKYFGHFFSLPKPENSCETSQLGPSLGEGKDMMEIYLSSAKFCCSWFSVRQLVKIILN